MKLRVSAVQHHLHTIHSFEEFEAQVTHYVKTAEEYESEFVLFPEFMTTQLMSIGTNGRALHINELPVYTNQYVELFTSLAKSTGMHLIGGTHVVEEDGKLYNAAHLFYPDGRVAKQSKLHITPTEVKEWNITPGESLQVFQTDKGKIGIITCYDMEFPEIVRLAKAKGADVIFCPSCTDDAHGFHRVRYSCHARTIENQIYVVTTGTVGSLQTVDFMRANYGQAAVITPNDIPFPPGGILAQGDVNQDMIITADLDLNLLYQVRKKDLSRHGETVVQICTQIGRRLFDFANKGVSVMYKKELYLFKEDLPVKAVVRNYTEADFHELIQIQKESFPPPFPAELWWNSEQLKSHVTRFPEGALCVEIEGTLAGSMTGLIVQFDPAHPDHTWEEITDNGYIRNHNAEGNTLYVVDICVRPAYRKLDVGKCLMQSMYEVVVHKGLERLLGGGRMPGYHRHADRYTPDQYVESVVKGKLKDPVITFLMRCGRSPLTLVSNYLEDEESHHYGVLMEWRNPFILGEKP